MKRILKISSALLAIIGVVMMFFTQVTAVRYSGHQEVVAIKALVGGASKYGTDFTGVGAGLAGYILLGVGALIILVTALLAVFREHDILSAVVTGLGLAAIIVGVILIFLIRKNFADQNGPFETVYVGWGAMVAGGLGSISALLGLIGMFLDLSGNN